MPNKKDKFDKSAEIDLLTRAIEDLIDTKLNKDGAYLKLFQARADIKEALALLLDVEYH